MKTSNQFSKTKMCAYFLKGKCKKGGKECLFAHSPEEIRPMPNLANTKLCPSSLRGVSCANRDCQFAHDASELKSTDFEETHKTVMCFFYKRGKCLNGPKCRFAHGNGDLRLAAGEAHSNHQKGFFASGRSKQLPANNCAVKTSSGSTQLPPPSSATYTFEQDTSVANCSSSSSSITRPPSSYLHSGSLPPISEISSLSPQCSFSPCPLLHASPSARGRTSVSPVSLPFLNSLSARRSASSESAEALCCSSSLSLRDRAAEKGLEKKEMNEVPCSDSGVPKITVTSPEGYVMRPLLAWPQPAETRRVESTHRWSDILSENEEDVTRRWRQEAGDSYDVHSSSSPRSNFSCPSSSSASPSSSPSCSPATSFSASPRPSTSSLLETPMAGYQTDDDHHFAQCYSKYVEHIQKAPTKGKHLSNLPCNQLYKQKPRTKRGEGQVPSCFPLFQPPLPLSTLASSSASLAPEPAALGCGFGEPEKAEHNSQTSSPAFFHIPLSPPPPPALLPVSLLPPGEQTQTRQAMLRKEDTVPLICADQLAASLLPLLVPQPNDAFSGNYVSVRHPPDNALPFTSDSSSIENAYEALKVLLRTVQQQQMLLSQLLGVSPLLSPHWPSSVPNATQQTAMAATAFGSSWPSPLPPPLSLSSFPRPLLQETVHQPGRI